MTTLEQLIEIYNVNKGLLNNINDNICEEQLYHKYALINLSDIFDCNANEVLLVSRIETPSPNDIIGVLYYYYNGDYTEFDIDYIPCYNGIVSEINKKIEDRYIVKDKFIKLQMQDDIKQAFVKAQGSKNRQEMIEKMETTKKAIEEICQSKITEDILPKAIVNHVIIPFLF